MRIPNKYNGYSADNIRLYYDPVTMALVGAAAGAALKPNDPLRGAMLGATVGFTGGTVVTRCAAFQNWSYLHKSNCCVSYF